MKHAVGDTILVVLAAHRNQIRVVAGHRTIEVFEVPDKTLFVSNMGLLGDTLWIADDAGRRVMLFWLAERSWSERIIPTVQPGSQPAVLGVLRGGAPISVSAISGGAVDVSDIAIVRSDDGPGEIVDSLRAIGGELRLTRAGGFGEVRLLQPWVFRDFAIVERDGSSVTVVRQRPAVLPGATIRISAYRLGDAAASLKEWEVQTDEVGPDVLREWADRVMTDSLALFFGGIAGARERLTNAVFRPLQMPVIRRIISAGRGMFLVERADSRETGHAWELWGADGAIRGQFRLPENQELNDAVGNDIYLLEHGADRIDRIILAAVIGK
jgi:hypothetical protein